MSRTSAAKKARRKKRQTARDKAWLPAGVVEELEIASQLEEFDARLVERGWAFGDDSDESGLFWIWPESVSDIDHDAGRADATVVMLSPDDGGEIAHVVFVGSAEDYQFDLDELFDHIDAIEAYRIGGPAPVFG